MVGQRKSKRKPHTGTSCVWASSNRVRRKANGLQDVQKGFVLTRPPQRAKTRRSPYKTAASEGPRRYIPSLLEPLASITCERIGSFPSPYVHVEGLNDARTKLADFFNILLQIARATLHYGGRSPAIGAWGAGKRYCQLSRPTRPTR